MRVYQAAPNVGLMNTPKRDAVTPALRDLPGARPLLE